LFFPIGKHATYHPEILRQVAAAGHTIGAHTWSHANLNTKKLTDQQAKDEVEKGFSAVKLALGASAVTVLSLSGIAAWSRRGGLSRHPQHRDLLLRRRFLRFQGQGRHAQIINTVMTKIDKPARASS
jgi:peptidoglycan/xylan/chitin deacetylase (PgdA/CDA1 family)